MKVAHRNDSNLILEINSSSFFSLEKATMTVLKIKRMPGMVPVRLTCAKLKSNTVDRPPEQMVNILRSSDSNLRSKKKKTFKSPRIVDGIKSIHPINLNLFGKRNLVSIFTRFKIIQQM